MSDSTPPSGPFPVPHPAGGFPAPYFPPRFPPPKARPSRSVTRIIAGLLGLVAAALLIVGSFLPDTLFIQRSGGKVEQTQTVTLWDHTFSPPLTDQQARAYGSSHPARFGIPLTVIAAFLFAGATISLISSHRAAGPYLSGGARNLLLAGGGAASAGALMLTMDLSSALSYEQTSDSTFQTIVTVGLGFWLTVSGGLLAAIAAVLVLLPKKPPIPPAPPPYYPAFQAPPANT